jgi:hypothetical protein
MLPPTPPADAIVELGIQGAWRFSWPNLTRHFLSKKCPYGAPGDRLWVRESFQPLLANGVKWPDANYFTGEGYAVNYVATGGVKEFHDFSNDEAFSDKITPSIFMPRWASRITLEVVNIRAQRLQDISEEDAQMEGAAPSIVSAQDIADVQISDASPQIKELARILGPGQFTAKFPFREIWNSINAKRGSGWDKNPWVWAITFKVVHPC